MYPKQMERLKAVQNTLNYEEVLGTIGDVNTRWNSSYIAWERLLYLKDAIDQLAIELTRDKDSIVRKDGKHLKSINLSDDEWIFMESLVNLLALFEEATTFLSGSSYATLSLMYPTISEIKKLFNDRSSVEVIDLTNETTILDEEDSEVSEDYENDEVTDPITKSRVKISQPMPTNGKIEIIKNIISQALDKYWSVQLDIALKAAFLDPRFKHLSFAQDEKNELFNHFKTNFKNINLIYHLMI